MNFEAIKDWLTYKAEQAQLEVDNAGTTSEKLIGLVRRATYLDVLKEVHIHELAEIREGEK